MSIHEMQDGGSRDPRSNGNYAGVTVQLPIWPSKRRVRQSNGFCGAEAMPTNVTQDSSWHASQALTALYTTVELEVRLVEFSPYPVISAWLPDRLTISIHSSG